VIVASSEDWNTTGDLQKKKALNILHIQGLRAQPVTRLFLLILGRQLVRRAGTRRAEEQYLAIGQRQVAAVRAVRAVLGLIPVNHDYAYTCRDIAFLQRRRLIISSRRQRITVLIASLDSELICGVGRCGKVHRGRKRASPLGECGLVCPCSPEHGV